MGRFPRTPVNTQKQINASLDQKRNQGNTDKHDETYNRSSPSSRGRSPVNPLARNSSEPTKMRDYDRKSRRSKSKDRKSSSKDRGSKSKDQRSRERRSKSRERRHRDRSRDGGKRAKEHKNH